MIICVRLMIDPPPNPCMALAPINQVIDFAAPQSAMKRECRCRYIAKRKEDAYVRSIDCDCERWAVDETDGRLTGTDEERKDTRDHQGLAADDVAVGAQKK
jgi:hypothetical protein